MMFRNILLLVSGVGPGTPQKLGARAKQHESSLFRTSSGLNLGRSNLLSQSQLKIEALSHNESVGHQTIGVHLKFKLPQYTLLQML
jgi:hypothetical protein